MPRRALPFALLPPRTTCWPRRPNNVARALGEGLPGGRFNLGDLTAEEAYPLPEARGLLVLNTLPWARKLIVDEPEQRGGAAPVGVLDMFFPPGVPWGEKSLRRSG